MSKTIVLENNACLNVDGNDKVIAIIVKASEVNIEYKLENDDFRVLLCNYYDGDSKVAESGYIKNGTLKIDYIDLNNHKFIQDCHIDVYKDSSIIVNSIYLGINDKYINFDLKNKESDSHIDITNNVVVLDEADFKMNVVGTILKGAKRSTCFQKSHCLTVDNPKRAKVLPVLNIDENDVEASHSLSIGTIDEEILFYMNARGLNKKESLNLMVQSYLIPEDNFFNEFENGEELKNLATSKVQEICMM